MGGRIFSVFEDPRDARLPDVIRVELLSALYGGTTIVWMLGSGAVVIAGAGALWPDRPWLLAILALLGSVLAVRLGLMRRFTRARAEGGRLHLHRWTVAFGLTAVAASALLGLLAALAIGGAGDPVLATTVVLLTGGAAATMAARDAAVPRIAFIELVLCLAPVGLAALVVGDAPHLGLAAVATVQLAALVRVARERHDALVTALSMREQLAQVSRTDHLTGLLNRRGFETQASRLWRDNTGRPVSVLLIDVDHFKAFNDRHGHAAGDEILFQLAACMQGEVAGSTGILARHGGEEFAALGPFDEREAWLLAARVRRVVEDMALVHGARPDGEATVSVSIGVATGRAGAITLADLVEHADRALYTAKHRGRNRVVSHGGAEIRHAA